MLTLITISAAVLQGLVALVVFIKQRHSATNILFALLSTSLVFWAALNYFATSLPQTPGLLVLIRWVILFVVLQNTTFVLFAVTFPSSKMRIPLKYLVPFLLLSLVVALDSLSPFLFSSVIVKGGEANPIPAPGIGLFVLHALIAVSIGLRALVKKFRQSKGVLRAQLQYMLVGGFVLGLIIPITNFIMTLVFQTNVFPKFSSVYTLIFSSLMAYAIIRQRLFDIRSVIARSIAYILLLLTFAAIYGSLIFGISSFFFRSEQVGTVQNGLYIALAIILAFTFQPLRRFFEKLTDRIFYRDRYDSQEVLNAIGKILAQEIQLEPLLNNSLAELCRALRIEVGQFMIFEKGAIYKAAHYGPLPPRIMVASTMRRLRHTVLLADEMEGGEQKKILDEYDVRLSLRLQTRDEFVGFLFLGDKLSGDIYSNQDLQLLEILAQELSIAIINAKAYEEIELFNVTLQERVEHATARLRVANHNLKALDKAKDEFISMASHQLRTPLTTIKGYLSMIIEGDAGQTTPEQKEFLDYAFGGAERMVSLISDLLNVSRLSAGRFVIEKKPTDLAAVVADEVRQLQSHADAKHLQLVFTPPKHKLPMIDLDEGKTRQVIMNYIDNAIYYTKQGEVHVSLTADKDEVEMRVKDSGIGVPEEAKKKLFSKFFRAENAQVARPDGTGLGLYLAKRVVEDQGGQIIFESEEGKGSTFGFTMPIKSAAKTKK